MNRGLILLTRIENEQYAEEQHVPLRQADPEATGRPRYVHRIKGTESARRDRRTGIPADESLPGRHPDHQSALERHQVQQRRREPPVRLYRLGTGGRQQRRSIADPW